MKAFPKQAYNHVTNSIPVMQGGSSYGVGNNPPATVTVYPDQSGMDLRDYFAAKAMQAMISIYGNEDNFELAKTAYSIADAMIEERLVNKNDSHSS